MKQYDYFLGIDIAKDTFAASLYHAPTHTHVPLKGSMSKAHLAVLRFLKEQKLDRTKVVMAIEATGVYGDRLSHELVARGCCLYILQPAHVQRTKLHPERKSDPDDSRHIAEHLSEKYTKQEPWEPSQPVIDQLRTLLAERRGYIKAIVADTNRLKAVKHKYHRVPETEQRFIETIQFFRQQLAKLEAHIQRLIRENAEVKAAAIILRSSPMIGPVSCSYLLVSTDGGRKLRTGRQVNAWVGVAPNPYQSGKMEHTPHASGFGNPEFRRVLRMAAWSAANHNPHYRAYMKRKSSGDNPKPLNVIYNNIGNHILQVACAVLKSGKPYDPNYQNAKRGG